MVVMITLILGGAGLPEPDAAGRAFAFTKVLEVAKDGHWHG